MKKLIVSYADPEKWRSLNKRNKPSSEEWKKLRLKILSRDDYTCQYCGYRSEKFQIVDHINGDPQNNDESNLQTICQMCNLIKHAGQGCVIKGVVDLYKESKYNQNDIIRITREMRDGGKSDEEIIRFLGLKHKMPFKMDKEYLKQLYGFVTSRSTRTGNDMYDRWKTYHTSIIRKLRGEI
ncbi:MAG: HNH endonuclease [Candidatus Bathyarchaeia archaeon]